MFRISRHRPGLALIDLSTLRETVHYMKCDADRYPDLEGLSKALDATLLEINRAERKLTPPDLSPLAVKFLPRPRL